ncbi:hypothetical protein SANTM175S_04735 [Streptomyces antimycoticus]
MVTLHHQPICQLKPSDGGDGHGIGLGLRRVRHPTPPSAPRRTVQQWAAGSHRKSPASNRSRWYSKSDQVRSNCQHSKAHRDVVDVVIGPTLTAPGRGSPRREFRPSARGSGSVVLAARRKERVDALTAELTEAGHEAEAYVLDVTDRAAVESFAAAVDRCDVLVNNAGGAIGAGRCARPTRPTGGRCTRSMWWACFR